MAGLLLAVAALAAPERGPSPEGAAIADENAATVLRVLSPEILEIELVQEKSPGGEGPQRWNFVTPAAAVSVPRAEQLAVEVNGQAIPVKDVGLKRRVLRAPLQGPRLRLGTWLYLRLERTVPDGARVVVANPAGDLWPRGEKLRATAEATRASPAIHVNEVGYEPDWPKHAIVGHYLGSLGEMALPPEGAFRVIDRRGETVLTGRLRPRPDCGYVYSPTPYQQVGEADFSELRTPGEYRVVVAGLGASAPFRIGDGAAMAFARAYALGLYHQRCGAANELPFTRFVHAACHVAPATVPLPEDQYPFTWRKLAELKAADRAHEGTAASGAGGAAAWRPLFPYVRRGEVDVAGGHHDAGDYSKYTINSAAFVHVLLFAVDSLPGGAACDNLGLPESGDGVPDLLQEAKWELDFLARMQDEDGGFYFLVYPRDRAYESDVRPDEGDPQVVWPKNTAATAAAVAALAQASSSPWLRRAYPEAAAAYLAQARKGWRFLAEAIARYGKNAAYQRLTHYGDNHGHDDELAWAAAELFLATGEAEFHDRFREWCDPASAQTRRWGWWRLNESWGNAIRSYAFGAASGRIPADRLDARLLASCRAEILAAGRDVRENAEDSAYGTSFPAQTKRMRGGGWYFSLDQAFDLAVASQLEPSGGAAAVAALRAAYVSNLDYEAGVNPLNLSYVTGLGARGPREVVHQFALNDRRVLPPSGLPVGNIQAGPPYLPRYGRELGALSYPEDGAARAPYPYYDRWTDTHNVVTEFVIVNQARALAGLVWLAAPTAAGRVSWRAAEGRIEGLPAKVATGSRVTAHLVVPGGPDLDAAEITWEAAGGSVGGGPVFTFAPAGHGETWVEAEAVWPDGRRVFAAALVNADNGRPGVTIETVEPTASVEAGTRGVIRFRRTGDLSGPLRVHFKLEGTAGKWTDYRRPEGDMPVEMTIPAGQESVDMSIVPVAAGLGSAVREVRVVLKPDEAYNVGAARAASVTVRGKD